MDMGSNKKETRLYITIREDGHDSMTGKEGALGNLTQVTTMKR